MPHAFVVRIYVTTQEIDLDTPWQFETPSSGNGSGVVVSSGRVLTGAHVVANATFVQVQKVDDPRKYLATVCGVCHDADLALLEVEDAAFMDGVEPAEIGPLPSLRDPVQVVGYPIGGEEISITEGVVSRVEAQCYSHSDFELLAVTVDAAINSGNSGGPVLVDDKVAGIAFQSLRDAENIGEMVPATVIRRFLDGIEGNKPLAVPSLAVATQSLENPALRRATGIDAARSGVLVRSTEFGGSCHGVLEPGDVILSIDGHDVADNGTVRYMDRHRTSFSVLMGDRFVGERIPVRIVRDGQEQELEIELRERVHLVPREHYDYEPTWFVFGGLVFQVLTENYLHTWKRWLSNAPKEFLYAYHWGVRTENQQEMVILTDILADEINVGYEPLHDESIVEVNGTKPANMREFVATVDACQDVLDIRTSLRGRIVLDVKEAREASARILEHYHVPRDRSQDLR